MKIYHNDMILNYLDEGKSFSMLGLSVGENANGSVGDVACPNFHLSIAGENGDMHSGHICGGTHLPYAMECINKNITETGITAVYLHPDLKLEVTVKMDFVEKTNVIRQENRIRNLADEDVTVTHFSSANVMGIAADGLKKWYDNTKIKVHYCMSSWQGEGQWRSDNLENLGLYPTSIHQTMSSIQFSSIGSWSTVKYYPMCMIEDVETGQIWYFEIEAEGSWHYEIGQRKSIDGYEIGSLYFLADCADEMSCGWYKTLRKGEEYVAAPVIFGCTSGGFDEAIHQLHKYKRLNKNQDEKILVFNDYMNCLWARPSKERLLPLIDAAYKVGAEAFCIDAGWYKSEVPALNIGDWEPDDSLFGQDGLKSIIDYIKSKNMKPGLWLELESCASSSDAYCMEDECFAVNHGKRVHRNRSIFDFRNPKVCDYMMKKISFLIEELGVAFFKNDYNQSIGAGDNKYTSSSSLGTQEQIRAFYKFINCVQKKYPHVLIENCGSGGLRHDYGAMKHFNMQSTSDQEHYFRYPSIISGTLATLLPEHAGIWSYPYPVIFESIEKSEEYKKVEVLRNYSREETIFNMINGMCGNMYLSGRIDYADEEGLSIIKEGVDIYKQNREWLFQAYPIYPCGTTKFNDDSFSCIGFIDEKQYKILLAFWRINSKESEFTVDLSKWCTNRSKVNIVYPSNYGNTMFCFNKGNKSLSIKIETMKTARLFEIIIQ